MKGLYKIVNFVVLPIVIIGLLYVNGKIAEDRYGNTNLNKAGIYKASISTNDNKLLAHQNEEKYLHAKVKNTGTLTWIPNEKNDISMSYHIIDTTGKVITEGERTKLPNAVRSGDEVEVDLKIVTPKKLGNYKIEIDMVQEGVTWFKAQGSKTTIVDLVVE